MVRGCGVEMETWIAEGTHSFDEPSNAGPMAYDPALAEEAIDRFGRFHKRRGLERRGRMILVDPKLCLYYGNRLAHSGIGIVPGAAAAAEESP